MPIWSFYCSTCKTTSDLMFTTYEASRYARCRECGTELDRLPSTGGFVLKGKGFYKNDYRGK